MQLLQGAIRLTMGEGNHGDKISSSLSFGEPRPFWDRLALNTYRAFLFELQHSSLVSHLMTPKLLNLLTLYIRAKLASER